MEILQTIQALDLTHKLALIGLILFLVIRSCSTNIVVIASDLFGRRGYTISGNVLGLICLLIYCIWAAAFFKFLFWLF